MSGMRRACRKECGAEFQRGVQKGSVAALFDAVYRRTIRPLKLNNPRLTATVLTGLPGR